MRPSVISVSIAMLGPGTLGAAFALGVAYFEAYELDAARQVLESVANNPETRSGAQLYLGRVALSSNQPDAAASHFLQAIQVNPKLPDAHAELALIRMRRGDYALAQKDLAAALAVSPDHYLSNLRLLMLYERTRDPKGRRSEAARGPIAREGRRERTSASTIAGHSAVLIG